ncbi:hypothetical protein K402DRAFT_132654 [Aulographum hederae CBS 113979]|uniref:Uncharacterized protein n=1 Tax=Aulographum hederae CBS 113979 TaxID=1176131 RepID=A0A6G1GV33_9PEZI|nr:hypothetical protein K402DRAFT_132654 [Aulographum hederae CBS 113979]
MQGRFVIQRSFQRSNVPYRIHFKDRSLGDYQDSPRITQMPLRKDQGPFSAFYYRTFLETPLASVAPCFPPFRCPQYTRLAFATSLVCCGAAAKALFNMDEVVRQGWAGACPCGDQTGLGRGWDVLGHGFRTRRTDVTKGGIVGLLRGAGRRLRVLILRLQVQPFADRCVDERDGFGCSCWGFRGVSEWREWYS